MSQRATTSSAPISPTARWSTCTSSVQNYPAANPRPYDDTGWTMQYMRNVKVIPVTSKAILDGRMSLITADAKPAGGIDGTARSLWLSNTPPTTR